LPSIEEILRRDAIGRLQCKRDAASTDSTPIGRGWEAGCRSDLALHLGEVLYSNVGAVDRLEVTVIGPAVNEVARVEKLCQPPPQGSGLRRTQLAAASGHRARLEPLGTHLLRGVREPKELFARRR
jgi:class 3 adenylate cyclase